jgi:hypothetical protein
VDKASQKSIRGDEPIVLPKYLYRYLRYRNEFDSLRQALKHNNWWFGSRANFDDEDDSRLPGIVIDGENLREMNEEFYGAIDSESEQRISTFLQDPESGAKATIAVQGFIDRVGMLCLSETPNSQEMWNLYSDGGRGVCLCFEASKLAFDPDFIPRGPFPVQYSDEPKRVWDPRGEVTFQLKQTANHVLRKAARWSYQKEWRLWVIPGGGGSAVGYQAMPRESLKAVIFGSILCDSEIADIEGWIVTGPFTPDRIRRSRTQESSLQVTCRQSHQN